MSTILRPISRLVGRAETAPELVLYRGMLERSVESLIQYAWGRSAPSSAFWDSLAVSETTPKAAPGRVVFEAAHSVLAKYWPGLASTEPLRAFQILGVGRRAWARINHEVRGRLTARLLPNPQDNRKPLLHLLFELHPDEPENVGSYTVFQLQVRGRTSAILFWDVSPFIVREASAADVEAMIRRSLPSGGPKERWDRLVRGAPVSEIPGIYWGAAQERLTSDALAFRTLEGLEASVRVGEPSRRSSLEGWVSIDEPDGASACELDREIPSSIEGEDSRIDLEKAIEQLDPQSQRILSMYYYEGHTDEEIAGELQISHQAVNQTRQKIIRKLRDRLSN